MARIRKKNRIDANQPEIVDALREIGAMVISMTGDPTIGFDILVGFRGKLFAMEIKDGSKPPSKRQLTDDEKIRRLEFEAVDCDYFIPLSVDDALRAIGAIT